MKYSTGADNKRDYSDSGLLLRRPKSHTSMNSKKESALNIHKQLSEAISQKSQKRVSGVTKGGNDMKSFHSISSTIERPISITQEKMTNDLEIAQQ